MADAITMSFKRRREEAEQQETNLQNIEITTKRQKSYDDLLFLLEEEEEEPNQDLSSLITTLQQEISPEDTIFAPLASLVTHPENENSTSYSPSSSSSCNDEEDDKERVMRHLLEASDTELGIPSSEEGGFGNFEDVNNAYEDLNEFSSCVVVDGLWELEDEAANYYTLLQSELFMM